MGGNPVQFQDPSFIKPSPPTSSSSSQLMLLDKHDDHDDDQIKDSSTSNDHQVITNNNKKNKKMKKLKKKKKKQKDVKVIKVFKADGEIKVYQKPIKVSEVMTDEYMVCRSDSFYIGQKIPPLSQHDRLQPGQTYFLLPSHLFHSVLSFVTIASITASSSCSNKQQQQLKQDHMTDVDSSSSSNANQMKMKAAFLKKAAASSCSPFDIQKTPSGTLRIRVSEMFISQLMMDQAAAAAVASEDGELIDQLLLCTTPQLHREYKQLVVGGRRGWKPKLEMIKESPPKGKRKVKMLLSASISRMKKKIKNNKSPSVPQTTSSSLSSSASASSTSSSQKKKKKKANKQTNVVSKTK